MRMNSDYSSLGGNKLSEYDILIKQGAEKLGWDWRLLALSCIRNRNFKWAMSPGQAQKD